MDTHRKMTIEHDIFARWQPDAARLRAHGFREEGGRLVHEAALPEARFSITVEYDGEWRATIMDVDMGEEYTNHRLENATGFNAMLLQQLTGVLLDIRAKCCENQYFRTPQARRIHRHIAAAFGDAPEFLWKRFPGYAIYRHPGSKKWYAVIGNILRNKVDRAAANAQEVEALNLKADKAQVPALLQRTGIYPAWHMDKKSWLTIILDDTLPDGEIAPLIAASRASVVPKTAARH